MLQRGVVLAGGRGSRMGELTRVTNKHLLPVGMYPMIYYPIKKLIGAGIRNIMLVTGTEHMGDFVELLGSGSRLGCDLTYRVQDQPGGIAQALALAEPDSRQWQTVVLLGDNIFYEPLHDFVRWASTAEYYARLMLCHSTAPDKFGVVEFNREGDIVSIEEKPKEPKTNKVVTGVYVYPPDVFDVIKTLKPSERGELEITDVNNFYVKQSRLQYSSMLGYWMDAGSPDTYVAANRYVSELAPVF